MGRAAPLVLGFATLIAACFDSGTRWEDVQADSLPATPACKIGEIRCGIGLEQCAASATGASFQVVDDCGAKGQVCAPSLGKCTACLPNATSCQGFDVISCSADGSMPTVLTTCDPKSGEACRAGACVNLCRAAADERSNVGCEYWGVDLDNAVISATENAAAQQYAIVVSNAQPDVPAEVQILEDDGQPGDAPAPTVIATATIAALNLQVFKLGPREVDGSPDGEFNTGTNTALTRHAYRVMSNVPVVAFQFNPLDNVNVFSNDASLLKPVEALEPDGASMSPAYVVAGWPQTIAITDDPNTNFDPASPINLRAFLTIVGTRGGTHVKVKTQAAVVAGGPVTATPIGGTIEATLDPYDVLNLETGDFNADFTGSIVSADGPIAVFSGSEASDAPHFTTLADRRCCADHLEQQLDPLRTAGKTFAFAHTPNRSSAVKAAGADIGIVPQPEFFRFVNASSGAATVTTSLPAPDDSFSLSGLGDWHEVGTTTSFTAQASGPVHVSQMQASQDACGVVRGLPGGDPSLIIAPPIEQFRPDYVFLTPDKYAFDFVSIIAPPSAVVVLDGAYVSSNNCVVESGDGLTDLQRGNQTPPFVVYQCQLSFPTIDPTKTAPNNIEPGLQRDGVHRILADVPVGVIVSGFDNYVSYAYAGGTELREIAPPQ